MQILIKDKNQKYFSVVILGWFFFFAHAGEIRQQRSRRGLGKDLLFKKITLHRRSGEPMARGGLLHRDNKEQ